MEVLFVDEYYQSHCLSQFKYDLFFLLFLGCSEYIVACSACNIQETQAGIYEFFCTKCDYNYFLVETEEDGVIYTHCTPSCSERGSTIKNYQTQVCERTLNSSLSISACTSNCPEFDEDCEIDQYLSINSLEMQTGICEGN
jgi:hypothetical protein